MARIKSVRTRQFKTMFEQLPSRIQQVGRQKFEIFKTDPFHPSFHRKMIQSTTNHAHRHLEFRITRDYRATCFLDGETYVWVFIGTHARFDRIY